MCDQGYYWVYITGESRNLKFEITNLFVNSCLQEQVFVELPIGNILICAG